MLFCTVSLPSLHVYDVKLRNFTLYGTGRKNGFASNLLSAKMMQICANWRINLSKGGKCPICIPIYTPMWKVWKIGIYHLWSDLFPSLHKFASFLRWANLKQIHFFVQCGGRGHKTTIFFFFCEVRYSLLEFNSWEKTPDWWQTRRVEIRAMKFKTAQILFLGDVFAAVEVVFAYDP